MPERIRTRPPPVPAPYLAGLPSLSPAQIAALAHIGGPTPQEVAEARRTFARLRALIRHARAAWERQHDCTIEPE